MSTKYYIDEDGVFLGGFGEGAAPPDGAVEITDLPSDGRMILTDGAWVLPALLLAESERELRDVEFRNALASMTYDLGGGRVIQVRPEDGPNFDNAYRLLAMTGAEEINWKMADNTFHPVTEAELHEAQDAGIMQGAALWVSYEADSA